MMICCSRNICNYYQCWKHVLHSQFDPLAVEFVKTENLFYQIT